MRLGLFLGTLLLAALLGVLALQVPAPRGPNAPATAFSTARAMVDVRQVARAPHPLGSAEHERVRGYLIGRMAALGLNPTVQTGALSPRTLEWLSKKDPVVAAAPVRNIVGVLPGRDPNGAAVVLMAHYDTVPGSPGAADDTAGVASALEAVRAIRARGQTQRPLIVLFTDGEELGLDGARVFFTEHPLRETVQAVVNLEARGGGGRAAMFQTGPGNAQTVRMFAAAAARADGGATSNSLAVLIYRLMPNDTDFTLAYDRRIAGINMAFLGRPAQYHSPSATPDALDQGSVQHIGSQALEMTDALVRTPALPYATDDLVFSDVLGRTVLAYPPAVGWSILAAAAALFAFAAWGARHATGLTLAEIGRGALGALGFTAMAFALIASVRTLSGPLMAHATSFDVYYVLMRRLPWMEAAAVLALGAAVLASLAGREAVGRRALAGLIAAAAVVAQVVGGFDPVLLGVAVVAVALTLWSQAEARTAWGGWLGPIALIGALAIALQVVAPVGAFILAWPVLLASLAAALAALIRARLVRPAAFVPIALIALPGVAWLMGLGHLVFLGVGMDLPGVLALFGLLSLLLIRPLAPPQVRHALAGLAAVSLVLACGVGLGARIAEPVTASSSPT